VSIIKFQAITPRFIPVLKTKTPKVLTYRGLIFILAVWTGTKPVKPNLVIHSGPIFYILGLFFLSPLGGQNCPPLEDKRFNETYELSV